MKIILLSYYLFELVLSLYSNKIYYGCSPRIKAADNRENCEPSILDFSSTDSPRHYLHTRERLLNNVYL
jgi:hypothetical protein